MAFIQTAVWLEDHGAHLFEIDSDHVVESKPKEHVHYTRQQGSQVRGEHEFFGEVCEALRDVKSVIVLGQNVPQAAFRQFVSKHRPRLALHIVGWKTMDHPTEAEVVKSSREFFSRLGGMNAMPRMT